MFKTESERNFFIAIGGFILIAGIFIFIGIFGSEAKDTGPATKLPRHASGTAKAEDGTTVTIEFDKKTYELFDRISFSAKSDEDGTGARVSFIGPKTGSYGGIIGARNLTDDLQAHITARIIVDGKMYKCPDETSEENPFTGDFSMLLPEIVYMLYGEEKSGSEGTFLLPQSMAAGKTITISLQWD